MDPRDSALDLAGRVTAARGKARFAWLSGGAFAMGIGIWPMHYLGMEAFRLPVPVEYDWPTVLVSMFAAFAASAVALYVVSRNSMSATSVTIGSILMGGGIAAMHYIGMEAMRLPAMCTYSSGLVALEIETVEIAMRRKNTMPLRAFIGTCHEEMSEIRCVLGLLRIYLHSVKCLA
jgi:two-component system sensor histidine kinase/response regulator